MKKLKNLLIYRNILNDDIINEYVNLFEKNTDENIERFTSNYYRLCNLLYEREYDSILDYIAAKILIDENSFSLQAEKGIEPNDKLRRAIYHDLEIFKSMFEYPMDDLSKKASDNNNFINYKIDSKITDFIINNNIENIYDYLFDNYYEYGSGEFREYNAFKLDDNGLLKPVSIFKPIIMNDIYGYNIQKEKIIKNTEKFVNNKHALNALLIGESGTGKSTAVKALIPMFKKNKLRLIEIDKDKLYLISQTIEMLEKRGMYFIIFIDDLSFESNENSYKHLKSVIEGSIYEQPNNILFYVTSNRRHLLKESQIDRENELHINDLINEQTSLSERFGLRLYYESPKQKEYLEIVEGLAKRFELEYDKQDLFVKAKQFAMQNGGRSGRTAVQFIKSIY